MKIELTVIEGPFKGRKFAFDGHESFFVGRGKQAHFQITGDGFFSRLHFLIEVNPPLCRLTDLESLNGTHVNANRVTVVDLHDGDVIRGGDTVIQVKLISNPADELLPATIRPVTARESDLEFDLQVSSVRPPPLHIPETVDFPAPAPVAVSSRCIACEAALSSADKTICSRCLEATRQQDQIVPGYTLVKLLGQGGMGVVALAVSKQDYTPVAVKMIRPDIQASEQDLARFLREAQILRTLQHPNIVSYRDMGLLETDGMFFTMDYVRGFDAGKLLAKNKQPFAVKRVVGWALQLLNALEFAHAQGYVHRDIKPQNLMIDATDSAREQLKLADFGLARMYQASTMSGLTMQGDLAGTFAYMAPDQLTNAREAAPTADIYSVGATMYTLLSAKLIYDFPKSTEKQVLMLMQESPVPLQDRMPDLPVGLVAIIHRALQRNPALRFGSAVEMREALQAYA